MIFFFDAFYFNLCCFDIEPVPEENKQLDEIVDTFVQNESSKQEQLEHEAAEVPVDERVDQSN